MISFRNNIVLVLLLVSLSVSGQEYKKQVGIRLGVTSGIAGKVIKDNRTAIEGSLGFRTGGIQMYMLLESYHPMVVTDRARWMIYFGGGAHIGYINGYEKVKRWSNTYGYYWDEFHIAGPVLGLDAVFGSDIVFEKVPIVLSLEFKPFIEAQAFQRVKVNFWDFGFGIAYRF